MEVQAGFVSLPDRCLTCLRSRSNTVSVVPKLPAGVAGPLHQEISVRFGESLTHISLPEPLAQARTQNHHGRTILAERYLSLVLRLGFINALNAMTGGKVVPLAGGVLILNADGEIVVAAGVSGA